MGNQKWNTTFKSQILAVNFQFTSSQGILVCAEQSDMGEGMGESINFLILDHAEI